MASNKGKKGRKVGRNANYCKAYRLGHRREHNKIKRLKKLLLTHPNNKELQAAIDRCWIAIRGYA